MVNDAKCNLGAVINPVAIAHIVDAVQGGIHLGSLLPEAVANPSIIVADVVPYSLEAK
jgi:hypothetical protein